MITIKVTDLDGLEHELEARPDEALMEVLREQDWGVAALCGGMCSCATDDFQPNSRLSCQLRIQEAHDGLCLVLAPEE